MTTTNDGPFELIAPFTPPDGVYSGIWGGYEVRMQVKGQTVRFTTRQVAIGLDCDVTVAVEKGIATVIPTRENDRR